ncbi:unnamed protein product [Mesocestoides corti]|uniref:Uncharacterized protein n=1 Tax=Mesocestoides corti TaxID=53468 RepID=A0A0R3UCG0_MESCO|nr:unnamed protein product [Mesocestoides corti]
MQLGGSVPRGNDWSAVLPNGVFGAKRPPPCPRGLGPTPTAVNFLQLELGHKPEPQNQASQLVYGIGNKESARGDRGSQTGPASCFEMKELLGLGKSLSFLRLEITQFHQC